MAENSSSQRGAEQDAPRSASLLGRIASSVGERIDSVRQAASQAMGRTEKAPGAQIVAGRAGGWQSNMDGTVETRVTLGQSSRGHHYAVEASYSGSDPGDLRWSQAYKSQAEAQKVASIREDIISGDRLPSPREQNRERGRELAAERGPAPGAAIAQALTGASVLRKEAVASGRDLAQAKAWVAVARSDSAASYRSQISGAAGPRTSETQKANSGMRI